MRHGIAVSILILVLASFSVGGAALAWFTFEAGLIQNVFTAGTVQIDEWEITSQGQGWESGECNELAWSFTNTGSKRTYVRVKPDVEVDIHYVYDPLYIAIKVNVNNETAWVGLDWINERPFITTTKNKTHSWAQYFQYQPGQYTEQSPMVRGIWTSNNPLTKFNKLGEVLIWDDGVNIYIQHQLYEGSVMTDTYIYVGLEIPANLHPGHFTHNDYMFSFPPNVHSDEDPFTFSMPVPTSNGGPEEINITWELCPHQSSSWVLGADGWWYYGTVSGPTEVPSEGTVEVCFTFCVPQGFNGTIDISLDAEAIQASHDAIHHVWLENPWKVIN
ncbi:hypothetical protein [Candidatus Contubernalis alkaliaceticus]|uniref:hypothetical protein n=1 Tax=Candidatus Contubernalis alkaliaceticus TaxID=338645 RepID=UPI001F4BEB35|nr:hypothetical protein [Candidatus Contubernalis alkalaceticus]UNC93469.1 hypothetical protein HUE98_16120 [Candidatus Contubernalis alkalaceticus]